MEKYNENLNWRYATKKFDPEQKLSKDQVETLLESIQLSASSYGLQPYEVFVIEDEDIRKKLKAASWDQPQITDASHLLVFANLTEINEDYVNSYLKNISKTRKLDLEKLKGLEDMLKNTVLQFSQEEKSIWAANQAYIALGNFLSAAASQKIDTCPMEGFDAAKYDEILGLKDKGLTTAVIATMGFRSEEDQAQHATKVRKNKEELFHLI
ncbi:NAD(P)H-dependent oxidoreductase [Salegentibacter chungangensis]|uniref:NAD(P)H-dependent oxidoreductase n=1 Tax=Salegentibacter chungangensis TaxID=1335724 RepID=A0ABW3NVA6_9FLAO